MDTDRPLTFLSAGRMHAHARLTKAQFRDALEGAGLVDVEIRETHRVHEHAGSAIIRARKPV